MLIKKFLVYLGTNNEVWIADASLIKKELKKIRMSRDKIR
jgi:hypothetical protein